MPTDAEFAFPFHYDVGGPYPNYRSGPGMTLRDYFAAQALVGLISSGLFIDPAGLFTGNGAEPLAEGAYLLANAMLAERAMGEQS